MHKIPLPRNNLLKIPVIGFYIALVIYFLPFVIGGYAIYFVFKKVNNTVLRNSVIIGIVLPTLFIGTAWAAGLTQGTIHPTESRIVATPTPVIVTIPTDTPTLTPSLKTYPTIMPTATLIPTKMPTSTPVLPTATPTIVYIPPTNTPTSIPAQQTYVCNCAKTCPQMSSCAEAQYQLNVCGCKARDADHDGIACDAQCQ
jgi:hypothetical protein